MKTKAAVFVLFFFTVHAQQCQAKELKKHKLSITPVKVIEAAFEVLTCTPEHPNPKIVEVKVVNGRKTVMKVVPVD